MGNKKTLLTIIVAIVSAIISFTVVFLVLNNETPKTFTKLEMQIQLTNKFAEKDLISQTAYYESRDMVVTALREGFDLAPGISSWSLTTYAQNCLKANNLTGIEIHTSEKGNYTYFIYEKSLNGKSYTYLATCHKSQSAFWLIQFGTYTSKFESSKDKMFTYIDSIIFDASSQY